MSKIGFCCKWIDTADQVTGITSNAACKKYNTSTTTLGWLNKQTRSVAEQRLWDLMIGNIQSVHALVCKVSECPDILRMVRISSDVLPAYTSNEWAYFWQLPDVKAYAEKHFDKIGQTARAAGVRLSFHPGQFCVLASDRPEVVTSSIREFEYHVDMARWMGYGAKWHDDGFKINVHISGRQGPNGVRDALNKMSPEARNLITIENEEYSHNLDTCLQLADILPITMDIHHHWINTGEYIQPNDSRVIRVIDSWRGIRPVLHYSLSREDVLPGHPGAILPDFLSLTNQKVSRTALRKHSDFYWNTAANSWAGTFAAQFDIQCEAKGKNLAAKALATELFG